MALKDRIHFLTSPEQVDAFVKDNPTAAIYKAGTCHKTQEMFQHVQAQLDPREDVPLGIIRVVEARKASNRVAEMTGIAHESPQLLLFKAGKEYGSGSSRDWAAKGTLLLGVRAVLAESYERIHRSNLVGMGVLPLQFKPGESAETFGITGKETLTIVGVSGDWVPRQDVTVDMVRADGSRTAFVVIARLDTPVEINYYRNGGILQTVLRKMLKA